METPFSTSALTGKFGPLPVWQWALLGGGGLALILYLKGRGTAAPANAGQLLLNPALSFGGLGDGGSGGGTTPPPTNPPPPTPPPPTASCESKYPLVSFAPGSKGGNYSAARPLAYWDCAFAGFTICSALPTPQLQGECRALTSGINYHVLGLGPDGCLYFVNPITKSQTKVLPHCGTSAAHATATTSAAQHPFETLTTPSVHAAHIR